MVEQYNYPKNEGRRDRLVKRIMEPSNSDNSDEIAEENTLPAVQNNKVFIVHGHDEAMKHEVARVVTQLGLEPIILHEQPNQGRTIIEKFEKNADAGFAVVLLSGDDMGYPANTDPKKTEPRPRARQNVVLELGYFVAKLGRHRVFPLYKRAEDFELPSDYHGVAYEDYNAGGWHLKLVQELRAANYDVDANNLIK